MRQKLLTPFPHVDLTRAIRAVAAGHTSFSQGLNLPDPQR